MSDVLRIDSEVYLDERWTDEGQRRAGRRGRGLDEARTDEQTSASIARSAETAPFFLILRLVPSSTLAPTLAARLKLSRPPDLYVPGGHSVEQGLR